MCVARACALVRKRMVFVLRGAQTSGASVLHEGFAGEKRSLPRHVGALVQAARQFLVQRLDVREAHGHLREHDMVDHEAAIRRAVHNALGGPLVPRRVGLKHVEQYIAVDEYAHLSVFASREGHDLVGGHLDVGRAAHLVEPGAHAVILAVRLAQEDRLSFDDELDLGVRQQSVALADVLWDGDLPFAGGAAAQG